MHSPSQNYSSTDRTFMAAALRLARRGMGQVSPNPLVGALLVRQGRIIGRGYHRSYGGPHAEAEAISAARRAEEEVSGADLYCNLEPCCFRSPEKHQPPCTELIIGSGIRRVFIANRDPHPKVNGRGIKALRRAGLEVVEGLLAQQGEELNRAFFTFQRLGRPFVELKIAQSLDGRIATAGGDAKWITDQAARRRVHRMRARHDAVLVGRGTALADDPELTVRLARGRNPFRVVLDSRLSLREEARILNLPEPERTIILCGPQADGDKIRRIRDRGVTVFLIKDDEKSRSPETPLPGTSNWEDSSIPGNPALSRGLPLRQVLAALAQRGIRSILVEGGGGIYTSFLREGLWDRLTVFIAPIIIGSGIEAVGDLGTRLLAEALGLEEVRIRRLGQQVLLEACNVYRHR